MTIADSEELEYQLKVNNDSLKQQKIKKQNQEEAKQFPRLRALGSMLQGALNAVDKNIMRMNLLNQFSQNNEPEIPEDFHYRYVPIKKLE